LNPWGRGVGAQVARELLTLTETQAARHALDVLPTAHGFDALLATIKALEGHGGDDDGVAQAAKPSASWDVTAPGAGRRNAPAWLRDLARRLDEEADYARRHAVRMGRFDVVPFIDRLSESIAARVAARFGERHSATIAARFQRDAAQFRRAVQHGA
jgi:hypothetical protein